jgi:hypothetical protein
VGTEIARYNDDIDADIRIAKALAESGFYKDVRDTAAGFVKLRIARELGLGLKGISDVHIVDGKPTLSYQAILGMVRAYTGPTGNDRYSFRYTRRDEECVEIEWTINGEIIGTSKCDTEDAKRMGVGGKQNWQKYPRQMRTARAVTEGVNAFMPEVIGGSIYTPEELGDSSAYEHGPVVVAVSEEEAAAPSHQVASSGGPSSSPLTLKPASDEEKVQAMVDEAIATMDAVEEIDGQVVDDTPVWIEAVKKFFAENSDKKDEYAKLLVLHGYLPEGKLTAKKVYESLADTLGPRCLEMDIVMRELAS